MFSSYLILTTTVKWQFLFTKPEAEPFALGKYLFILKPSFAQI
jgi:hypothetical protein